MTKSIFRLSAFPRQVRFSCCHSALSLSLSFCAVTFAVILSEAKNLQTRSRPKCPSAPCGPHPPANPRLKTGGSATQSPLQTPAGHIITLLVCKISTTRPLHRPAALCIGPFVWVNEHLPSCTGGTSGGTQVAAEGDGRRRNEREPP